MTERATFTYVGPDQHVRVGAETFQRHRETLVTDAETITAARAHPEIEEDGGSGRVPVSGAEPAEPAPEAPAADAPNPKRVRNRKKATKRA